jgi:hypothetical protein
VRRNCFRPKAGIQRQGACAAGLRPSPGRDVDKPLARALKSWKFARLANPGLDGRQNIVRLWKFAAVGVAEKGFELDAFSF